MIVLPVNTAGQPPEIITLDAVKRHSSVYDNYSDEWFSEQIVAVSNTIQNHIGYPIINSPVHYWFDHEICQLRQEPIRIYSGPVSSPVIHYRNEDNSDDDQLAVYPADDYEITINGSKHSIVTINFIKTPTDLLTQTPRKKIVRVSLTVGLAATVEEIPKDVKLAAAHLVAQWYDNRSSIGFGMAPVEIPFSVRMLLNPYVRVVA